MRQRAIVVTAKEARRIIAGRATMLIRPMQPQPIRDIDSRGGQTFLYETDMGLVPFWEDEDEELMDFCPFGAEGDRLWLREPWTKVPIEHLDEDADQHPYLYKATDVLRVDGNGTWYAARDTHESDGLGMPVTDFVRGDEPGWRRAILMPRNAARVFLVIERAWKCRTVDLDDLDRNLMGFEPAFEAIGEWEERWEGRAGNWFDRPWIWCCAFNAEVHLPTAALELSEAQSG